MACSAETLAAVGTGLCVTPVMGPASVASAGLDPAVRQVLQIFHNKKKKFLNSAKFDGGHFKLKANKKL